MNRVKVGLFGTNGHQIAAELKDHPLAEITAVAGLGSADVPENSGTSGTRIFESLDEMLEKSDVQIVSLCSPMRSRQADEAARCMKAGRHVYAEKPSALTEAGIDQIIATAAATKMIYHEQAGISLSQPYATLRKIVAGGALGEIVQVFAQKSYPWGDWRQQDENVDGGLSLQVGVYVTRFVEHVAGVKIKSLEMKETMLGNTVAGGQCRRACSMLMELANGGLASGVANYLCPPPADWKRWGYETLRIFGTDGFVESIDHGRIGTLALNGKGAESLSFDAPAPNYLDLFFEEIRTGRKIIPFTLEEELSPTRWAVRGKQRLGTSGYTAG